MEVNYNYNNSTILKFLRKVLNEINKDYVDSGMRTAFLLKRYIEKYYPENEMGPQYVLLCMLKDIGLFYMDGAVPSDNPALAAASSFTFLEHCSPLGKAAKPLLFYKAQYIEGQSNLDYDLGLIMTLLNQVVHCTYSNMSLEQIKSFILEEKKKGIFKPIQADRVIKLLEEDKEILPKILSESNLYIYETQKYISKAGYTDEELEGFIDTTVFAFEFHNHETLAHTVTTAEIAYLLALKSRLTVETADIIKIAARVHDIGKIRVPREVLCHPGRLDGEMRAMMQLHVTYTKEIIEGSFSYKIIEIASNHHERLDGTGYPRGLKAIDLSSADKVLAVADVCSALYCKRSYKEAFDDDKIIGILKSEASTGKLDTRIVNHLIDNFDEIMAVAKEKEAIVLEKYNAMKVEYEALSQSEALKHFFPVVETIVEEETEEQVVYVDEDGNIIEGYVPDENTEYVEEAEPEEIYEDLQDSDVETEAVEDLGFYDEESEEIIEESEDVQDSFEADEIKEDEESIEDFDEFLKTIPEEPEDFAETVEENRIDLADEVKESEEDIEDFDEFLNSIPEEIEEISDEEIPTSEEDEFESFLESIEDADISIDDEDIPEGDAFENEDNEESEEDEFEQFISSLEETE